jgi:hypothetical protein
VAACGQQQGRSRLSYRSARPSRPGAASVPLRQLLLQMKPAVPGTGLALDQKIHNGEQCQCQVGVLNSPPEQPVFGFFNRVVWASHCSSGGP